MSRQPAPANLLLRLCLPIAALLVPGLLTLHAGEAGNEWTWRNPLPQGNSLHELVKAGTEYLACGRAGTILASSDGITWSPRDPDTGEFLRRIAADGSTVVAVGRGGTITSSLDGGNTWTIRPSGTTADLEYLIRAGSRWVALDWASGGVSSADGVTWIPATGLGGFVVRAVAWSGSRLVAVGYHSVQGPNGSYEEEAIAHSEDGVSWTMVSGDLQRGYLMDIVWAGTQFIVTAQSQDPVTLIHTASMTSPDGLTWTRHQHVLRYSLDNIAWTGSLAVASSTAYHDPGGYFLYTSPDGIVWTPSAWPPLFTPVDRLVSAGHHVLAVGGPGFIRESDDHGLTWTERSSGVSDNLNAILRAGDGWIVAGAEGVLLSSPTGADWTRAGSGSTGTLRGIAEAGGKWLATGRDPPNNNDGGPGVVLTSSNGLDWATVPSPPSERLYSVIRAGDQWIAGGARAVHTSPDGMAWTKHDLLGLREVRGLATNGSRLVAVGGDDSDDPNYEALIYFSDNGGVSWTPARPPGFGTMLEGVTWTGSQFVAVGRNSLIYTSTTGAAGSWTARTAAGFGYFRSVASDATRIVIAGTDGIQTSANDGVTWTYSSVPTEETLYTVIKAGSQWVAAGYDGTLLTSPDALNWTLRETGTEHELYALTSTPAGLWVAGEGGTILSSVAGTGPGGDTDQDGLADLLETYFGTSPDVPNGPPFSLQRNGTSFLLLWPEADPDGKTITPQWSPDLVTWLASGEAAPGIPARSLTVTFPSAGQKQAALDSTGMPAAHLRLKVTQP